MTESRSKNTFRNILFGVINKLVVLLFPFAIRTIIIYKLGAEYVGVSSLFTSVLQVLSVAELGFSSAVLFSLYGPVSRNETDKIVKLIALLKTVYLIAGTVILVLGLIVTPFIGYFIKEGTPPDLNIYILFLIMLSNTVISYFVFGYKNSVLIVYQRNDIISKINIVIEILKGSVQILILLLIKNYYVYIVMLPVFTLLSNLAIGYMANKKHPELAVKMKPTLNGLGEIKTQLGGIAIGRLSLVCRNSFDSIIISTLLGLTITAIYSNYYLIFTSVSSFLSIFVASMAASVGNSLAVESIEKNEHDHIKFDFYYMLIVGFCTIFMIGLYQPFMMVWVGEGLMFDNLTMVLFCIYFYFNGLAQVRSVYSEAAGLWWHFRFFAIGEMLANLGLNVLLGLWLGVNGILLATIITSFVCSFVALSIITYKRLFKCSPLNYFLHNALYFAVTAAVCAGVYFLLPLIKLDKWPMVFVSMAICAGACILLFSFHFLKKETRGYIIEISRKFIKRG